MAQSARESRGMRHEQPPLLAGGCVVLLIRRIYPTFSEARSGGGPAWLRPSPWGRSLLHHWAAIIVGVGICLKATSMTDVTRILSAIEQATRTSPRIEIRSCPTSFRFSSSSGANFVSRPFAHTDCNLQARLDAWRAELSSVES